MKTLENKVALITGGSRGIGAAIARKLAAEGAKISITYQNNDVMANQLVDEINSAGGSAVAIQADSGLAEQAIAAVQLTVKHFGGLDILVNNAGIAVYDHISKLSLEQYDRVMDVNVKGVFASVQAAVTHLKQGGRIITIGSCQADRMPDVGGSLYAMSKSALIGLTKGFARDLGPLGITSNLIQPGPVDTDMNPAGSEHAAGQLALMAQNSFGRPEDIASMVAFIAGPEAHFVTGASLTIDGGTNC
ncbi:3-oxoacyl-ACP reductase family protein [Algoriphagus sp. Y33]|uniref:3-oxoacyl-ACP reductase family protein n=1 Tax=Algoriphagus sp. Y33 TaxID=2772483 RepID=UPI0017838A70|nr:3-oxoacyl-ACP reductase family protein [Algoriphagus sp. Y33]